MKLSTILFFLFLYCTFASANNQESAKRGAQMYVTCGMCHSLRAGEHWTGPSFDGLWGRVIGSDKTFSRYSESLKKQTAKWDEKTLDVFLASPEKAYPGNLMSYAGISDAQTRKDVIAFLKIAGTKEGRKKVIQEGLLNEKSALGQGFDDITNKNPENQVELVQRCGDTLTVKTRDGKIVPFWEMNVTFKVSDSLAREGSGRIVMTPAGSLGDRISIYGASVSAIDKITLEKCR